MEKVGYPKRDLMVKRVKAARESQLETRDQFKSALEQFRTVIAVDGSSLEKKYNILQATLDKSEARANEVHDRIDSIENVSNALFKEWKGELEQYNDQSLKRASEKQYEATKSRYGDLIDAMKRAESKMEPALVPLRDNVLFLKHNLNAQAINALTGELPRIQTNVDTLISDLDHAIHEADSFIGEMQKSA